MEKRVTEVFGMSNEVLLDSYVDRGALDEHLSDVVRAGKLHVALRGASKCGKSWLRRRILENPIVVQCRLHKTGVDLYTDALSQLDIQFRSETARSQDIRGSVTGTAEAGFKLLAKAGLNVGAEHTVGKATKTLPAGRDINDLRFIADIIRESGRKLVIEDFHYLSIREREAFAFDLKAFWDWGVQVIIVGVWSVDNMLLTLNPDLTGRVEEITITWNEDDLGKILDKGGSALNFVFQNPLRSFLVDVAYGNAGQLQSLVVKALVDGLKIAEGAPSIAFFKDTDIGVNAAMEYAEQLNPRYQNFARNVAKGIRSRTKSTNIYAHTMAVILNASDDELITGLSVEKIFDEAKKREARILLGNLKSILTKIESLQIDDNGRGLVLAYNPTRGVSVVDRQLLLYRRFATVSWPWEEIISSGSASDDSLQGDEEEA